MTGTGGDGADGAGGPHRSPGTGVLADRIAAALVQHEPGWRLPRLTALARRYQVSAAEVDEAIDVLASRHLLRRLPDGQVYRTSPAEYQVPLEGLSGLASFVDPMGGRLACRSRQVVRRRPPEEITRALRLDPGERVLAVRCLWTVGGEPGAMSASYLSSGRLAGGALGTGSGDSAAGDPRDDGPAWQPFEWQPSDVGRGWGADGATGPPGALPPAGGPVVTAGGGQPRALQIELAPPPPSVARALRLSAGELAVTVTISFEDPAQRTPVALTIAMLRPDLFRIVVQAGAAHVPAGSGEGSGTAWTRTETGWEP